MISDASSFKMEGYSFCGKSRMHKSAGGVGFLIKNDIKHVVTPHEPGKNIEIFWISIRQEQQLPIYCGVYYGKQESRNTKEAMKIEMDSLCEEILEKQNEGRVILFMDGNAKIGLLNENISRNGKLLLDVIEECSLQILNNTEICHGKITRVNRKKPSEKSAIDFVFASPEAKTMITHMTIDEEEKFVMAGKSPSDHNSIIVELQINKIEKQKQQKRVKWRLSAPEELWADFRKQLEATKAFSKTLLENRNENIEKIYDTWKKEIEKIATSTIGKTTLKNGNSKKVSKELKQLRDEKKKLRKDFEKEGNGDEKKLKLGLYIDKQKEVRSCIESEERERTKTQFDRMMSQPNGFWTEYKKQKQDNLGEWSAVKNADACRVLDPEKQKEVIAEYFENLYSPDMSLPNHERHKQIKEKMEKFSSDFSYDDLPYNTLPEMSEIEKIIQNKRNNKSTTDFPNEILKKGGKPLLEWIYHVVKYFWENEKAPKSWNQGIISTIYKGKGDREMLNFQRGITVSSTISMVAEEHINNIMTKMIPMTQAQGGGRKGSSTRDHLFILRGAMAHAIRNGTDLFITYYDVAKAYDRADVEDMLVEAWEHGLKGKVWRMMKILNTNLTAKIKTKHGLTREIQREAGGKQGGKNFGFLFAKMMDLMSEEADVDINLGVFFGVLRLSYLLWVDDVVSFAEGAPQQKYTLEKVNEFAQKHKLKWGSEKCKVMKVNKQKFKKESWKLGNNQIESCEEYTYLGDVVMKDNGNQRNIDERENRVTASTRKIIALCGSETIRNAEVWALLKLHETTTVPTLLNNCETWVLSNEDRKKLDRIELWAIKKIFGLPPTTPTTAIMLITGCLFATQRIDMKQLLYLKTILNRKEEDWTKISLFQQKTEKSWWAKQILELQSDYDLGETWEEVKDMSFATWKAKIRTAIEVKHLHRLKEDCIGPLGVKQKTRFAKKILESENYVRKPMENLLNRTKSGARALIMGMSGMLDCKSNFHHRYMTKHCDVCLVLDDEAHRINDCKKYEMMNLYLSETKLDFQCIYSNDKETLDRIELVILSLWDLNNSKNQMIQL